MSTRRRSLLLTLPALLLVTAACSGDDGLSADEQEFADKWAETLRDDEDGLAAEPDEAQCMGDAIMAELGTDPFEDADVTAEDVNADEDSNSPGELVGEGVISTEQADAILKVWEDDCVDVAELITRGASSEFELDEEGEKCFEDGLAEGTLARDLMRSAFTSGDDTPDEATLTGLVTLMDECGGGQQGDAIVSSIAEELSADGTLTAAQGQCVAQALVDDLGLERIIEVTGGGEFEDADPADQQEFASALLDAAGTCDVPLTALGG